MSNLISRLRLFSKASPPRCLLFSKLSYKLIFAFCGPKPLSFTYAVYEQHSFVRKPTRNSLRSRTEAAQLAINISRRNREISINNLQPAVAACTSTVHKAEAFTRSFVQLLFFLQHELRSSAVDKTWFCVCVCVCIEWIFEIVLFSSVHQQRRWRRWRR